MDNKKQLVLTIDQFSRYLSNIPDGVILEIAWEETDERTE